MKADRWQKVERLYHAALERPAESRAEYLRSSCGDDEELCREVESLLRFKSQAKNFIEKPALEVAAKAVAADNTSVIGQQISSYKILSLLGQGGMGEVYLAQDMKLGRRVALKFLPSHSAANGDRLRRFEQEARAASALNHPNIVTIHEIGEQDSVHFIATEFIDGETLRQRMTNARMKLGEALNIAIQTADALCAAHEAGIVHRDIKPENIMLRRRDSIVKVLDFGVAKLSEEPAATIDTEAPTKALIRTDPGVLVGTVAYMSPEQARGLEVDERTDIWSLGVVLYEMVAGRLPFEAATAGEALAAILSEKEPPLLAHFAREVPAELERIVEKALRKEREERYQVSKEMLLDLKSLKRRLEFEVDLERSGAPHTDAADAVVTSGQTPRVVAQQPATHGGDLITAPTTSSAEYLVNEIKQHRRGLATVLGMLALALAGLMYFYFARGNKIITIDSLAVLPFANTNADPETEYLSDGLADSLIDRLSQLPNLKVMSHSAVFHYRGREADPLAVGRELGVRAVLTGRLVKHNDALTINLELVDARDNSHIWGEQYDRKLSDILTLQREIPVDVYEKLRLPLSGESKERLTKTYTDNPEAYQLYLKGRLSWERWTLDGTKNAVEYFEEAIKKDPNYALAYSGLADAYTVAPYGTGLSLKEAHRRAREAATKALSLDPALGEPHAALADVLFYEDWDFAGAEREFRRAIELSPSYGEGHHMYSHFLLAMGRIDESLIESRKFLDLDPLSPAPNLHLGYQYLYARQYDLSAQQHLKTLEMDPNSALAHHQLGDTYYQKGMFDEAVSEYLKEKMLSGTAPEDITALKNAYATSGIRGYLQRLIEQFLAIRARQGGMILVIAAEYSRLGDKDRTFEWLERGCAEHAGSLVHLREELAFDNVRSDPRFADLLRRIGLPQ